MAGPEHAEEAVVGLDGPFVVKIVSRDILHKSDAGGVAVGLADGTAVAAAIRDMARKPAIAASMVDGTPTPAVAQGTTGRSGPDSASGRFFHTVFPYQQYG